MPPAGTSSHLFGLPSASMRGVLTHNKQPCDGSDGWCTRLAQPLQIIYRRVPRERRLVVRQHVDGAVDRPALTFG